MSRRPAVFDGSLPEPLDYRLPVEVSKMAQQDRQWQQDRQDRIKAAQNKPKDYGFINDYKDQPLSGTVADAPYTEGMANARTKAIKMFSEGASEADVRMALTQDVNQLNQYLVKAKTVKTQLEDQTKSMPSGYNKSAIVDKGLKIALLDDNGKIKDMNTVDPTVDYMNLAISNYPLETTNSSGLDEYVKSTFSNVKPEVRDVKIYNNKGGYTKKRMEVTSAPWQVFDVDEQGRETQNLVPKYETAYDNGNPIVMNGKPIRMVTQDVYDDIMKKRPDYMDHIRGQLVTDIVNGDIKDEKGQPVKLFSPQAQQYARHLVYEELAKTGVGGSKEIISEKPTQIKVINNNGGSGKGVGDVNVNDIFSRIKEKVNNGDRTITMGDGTKLQTTRLNTLDNDAATFVIDQANKALGKNGDEETTTKYGIEDLFLMQNDDGRIGVYKVAKDENGDIVPFEPTRDLVVNLNTVGTNIKNQPGAKEKREVIKKGNEQTAKTFNVINPKTGQVVMKGVSKEQAEAARKKGYNVQ